MGLHKWDFFFYLKKNAKRNLSHSISYQPEDYTLSLHPSALIKHWGEKHIMLLTLEAAIYPLISLQHSPLQQGHGFTKAMVTLTSRHCLRTSWLFTSAICPLSANTWPLIVLFLLYLDQFVLIKLLQAFSVLQDCTFPSHDCFLTQWGSNQ